MPGDLTRDAARVAKLAAATKLPGIEEGTSYGTPSLKVKGKFLSRVREPGVLVLMCSLEEKEFLIETSPAVYFETDHYKGWPAVLIRLAKVSDDELKHRLAVAWRLQAPKKLVADTDKGSVAKVTGARKVSVRPRLAKRTEPVLLSGGNPQIAKGDGDGPVQDYIAAIPGWKRDVGRRLDAMIEGAVPGVRKAVKWNSPFYGVGEEGWFLSFHCFTKYVKVAFFRGAMLRPLPPGASKQKNVRYLDIYEGALDEGQFVAWVKQASRLPGERM